MSRVSKENCARFLALADMHRATMLKNTAMRTVLSDLAEVKNTRDWALINSDLKASILEEIGNHYDLVEKGSTQEVPLFDGYENYEDYYEDWN